MLDKNKTYSYEELETIIKEAGKETVKKLDQDMDKARKENGNEDKKDMGDLMFMMSNMITTHTMEQILLGTEKEDK